ncbi:MAG: MBOAT family protein [Proteobacteria bacterium]|nr:MBOAT family protein [Pseudomonadota bacterium]
MLFNSFTFLVFLCTVLPVYYSLSRKAQNAFLLVASYIFYGFWDWRFLSLIFLSTVVDFFVAQRIQASDSPRDRKFLLAASLGVNLGVLCFYKYFDFFAKSLAAILAPLGLDPPAPVLHIILPVGISFYTFQTLGYTLDVYRGRQKATRNFNDYALYVSYFPQLVAGPIERAGHLLPQIMKNRTVTRQAFYSGLSLMVLGYFKKVGLADSVAPFVDHCFQAPWNRSALELYFGACLFSVQIYCDFSGYSDIARGVSRLFGIELMVNFRAPYFAADIRDFWRRWHISLSTWFRDYVYFPLGGNRQGEARTIRNLMATMLLCGLWHGPAWTFVIWGGLHGALLAGRRLLDRLVPGPGKALLPPFLGRIATFHMVTLAWVFFRADNLAKAGQYLQGLLIPAAGKLTPSGPLLPMILFFLLYMGAMILLDGRTTKTGGETLYPEASPAWKRGMALALMMAMLLILGETHEKPFLYFQF